MAGSVDAGVAVGQRDAERRLAFFDVFQHLREARTHSEAEGSMFFHVLSTGARPAAARLGALAAAPRRPTGDGLCLSQNFMVFRVRSGRLARAASWPSLRQAWAAAPQVPPQRLQGREQEQQRVRATSTVGGALGLFLLPGGLPLRLFGAATGCAAGGASSLAAAGSAPTSAVASAVGCPGCASASAAAVASSMLFFFRHLFN